MAKLTNKVAVVTGASSGIGRSIALVLAAGGATLCPIGRNAERLARVAKEARAKRARVLPFQVDLTQDPELDELVRRLRVEFEQIDVLVLSAGEHARGKIENATIDQLDALYTSNVRAPYRLIQGLLPMLRAARGHVVFVNSSVGQQAPAETAQFAATQHAIKAVADSLRQEINAEGVRVTNVFLGRVATPRQERIYESQGWDYQPDLLLQPDDVATMVVSAVSLPNTAEVTEFTIRPAIKSY